MALSQYRTSVLKIATRSLWAVVTVAVVSAVVFILGELGFERLFELSRETLTDSQVDDYRADLGRDGSVVERAGDWFAGLINGDLGRSLASGSDISRLIAVRLGNTLWLLGLSAVLATSVGLALAVVAVRFRGTFFSTSMRRALLPIVSVPEYFIAFFLTVLMAMQFGWAPAIFSVGDQTFLLDRLHRAILPTISIALPAAVHIMRETEPVLRRIAATAHAGTARLGGSRTERAAFRRLAARAVSPSVKPVSIVLSWSFGVSVLIESIFAYDGIGLLLADAVSRSDIPVIRAVSMAFATIYIVVDLALDVLGIVMNRPSRGDPPHSSGSTR